MDISAGAIMESSHSRAGSMPQLRMQCATSMPPMTPRHGVDGRKLRPPTLSISSNSPAPGLIPGRQESAPAGDRGEGRQKTINEGSKK